MTGTRSPTLLSDPSNKDLSDDEADVVPTLHTTLDEVEDGDDEEDGVPPTETLPSVESSLSRWCSFFN